MKIIHIVENLDKGAVENWLVNVFLKSKVYRPAWEWSFYCILNRPGRLDELVRKAGGVIYYSPVSISHKFAFLKHLRFILKRGKYDILHSHHDFLSGFYLLASWGISFKQRILHIHNNDRALPVGNAFVHKILLNPFKWLGYYFSDTVIAISKNTLKDHLGSYIHNKRLSCIVLYCGIDMSVFRADTERSIKEELNIPETAKLLLFVGRMNEYKNPLFVIDILAELNNQAEDIYALFIGKGELEQSLAEKAQYLNLEKQVRILGWRDDTARIMKQVDLFVFPRLEFPKEGLGLVVVEAQAAGLPMITTKAIVEDAIIIPELVEILPLENNAVEWADKVLEVLNHPKAIYKKDALIKMENSHFELSRATQRLIGLYEQAKTA